MENVFLSIVGVTILSSIVFSDSNLFVLNCKECFQMCFSSALFSYKCDKLVSN